MRKDDLQDLIIPQLRAFTGLVLVEGNQDNDVPDGDHAAFTFTATHIKETAPPTVTTESRADGFYRVFDEDFQMSLSFTTVCPILEGDEAAAVSRSVNLAENMREWFQFFGEPFLGDAGVVVVNLTDVINRDSYNDDDRRNGFDAVVRVHKTLERSYDYFDMVEINKEATNDGE